jgi:hypothetical protein
MFAWLFFAYQTRNGHFIDFRHDHSANVVRQLREFLSILISCSLLATTLFAISSTQAAAATTLTTCTDLATQKTVILKANQKSCKPLHATANWHIVQSDGSAHSGAGYASLRTCTSKRPQFDYQLLKSKCAKYQNTNDYWRTVTSLEIPIVASANARGYDSAAFALASTTQNIDAPIAFYLITNIKTGRINKVSPNSFGELSISNLSPLSSYTFNITAVSVDGTSLPSSITSVITTGAVPVVAPAPAPLAAPAFTLSSSSETRTVSTPATGFTILSTGGAIASFAISATPPGMSFSTSTGLLTGTPTSVASATSYTVTATNASGSATRIFTLTTTASLIGTTGPGGGTIFYFSDIGFRCGVSFSETGSATGGLCHYLEVAPVEGANSWGADPLVNWSGNVESHTGLTGQAIGQGLANTEAIIQQTGGGNAVGMAGTTARSYTTQVSGVSYSDWHLPSQSELLELYKWKVASSISGFSLDQYWSSSERDSTRAYWVNFNAGGNSWKLKSFQAFVRPIRAF